MGGLSVKNFSIFLLRRVYARGKLSLKECVDYFLMKQEVFDQKIERAEKQGKSKEYIAKLEAQKQEFGMVTSGCMEYDRGMVSDGFLRAALWHKEKGVIEPIVATDEQRQLWEAMEKNDLDSQDDFDVFDEKIFWRFTKGGRKMYLANEIQHIDHQED